jgi:hypothetical protein
MVSFIYLEDKERIKFFSNLKERIGTSWESFYPRYKISRSMFFNYLGGKYLISKTLFLEWSSLIKDVKFDFKEIEKEKYLPKIVYPLEMSESLAEILGVLNGDGHLSKIKYEVCVVGNLKEKEYYLYLKSLFENKLKLKFTLRKEKSSFKLRCYSKGLWTTLTGIYLLPKGNKLGKLKIPKDVKKKDNYLRNYLKGLYDTDGSIYLRRNKDPVVQITSADPRYLEEIRNHFKKIGYNFSKGRERIFLYGKENIKRFFREIKPANSKHLKKYQLYLNL